MPFTHLCFVASAFLLALGAVLSKLLLSSAFSGETLPNPLSVLTLQLSGGILFLVAVRVITGWKWISLTQRKHPALAGLILGIGSIGTIFALALISASEASLVFATQPAIVLVFAWILLGERIGLLATLLCLSAVGGVILTTAGGAAATSTGHFAGLGFAFLSASCAALYAVWMRGLSAKQDVLTALIVVQLVSCLVAIAGATGLFVLGLNDWRAVDAPFLLLALVTGALHYGAAYYLYLLGLKTTEASTAGIYLSLVPVFTIALALIFIGEALTLLQWVGAVIVIAAVGAVFVLSRHGG